MTRLGAADGRARGRGQPRARRRSRRARRRTRPRRDRDERRRRRSVQAARPRRRPRRARPPRRAARASTSATSSPRRACSICGARGPRSSATCPMPRSRRRRRPAPRRGRGPCRSAGRARAPRRPQPLERVPYLAAADMLVLPSHTEGTPNVVLEALASGRRVVATSVGGVPDLITDKKLGALVPSKNPDALARRARARLPPALRCHRGRAARCARRLGGKRCGTPRRAAGRRRRCVTSPSRNSVPEHRVAGRSGSVPERRVAGRSDRATRPPVSPWSSAPASGPAPGTSCVPMSPYIRQPVVSSHVRGFQTGNGSYVGGQLISIGSRQPSKLSALENGSIWNPRSSGTQCSPCLRQLFST